MVFTNANGHRGPSVGICVHALLVLSICMDSPTWGALSWYHFKGLGVSQALAKFASDVGC